MAVPVKHTCPDIDKVIRQLKDIQAEAKDGMHEHERGSDDHHRYKDIEWFIDSIVDQLEDLRKSNSMLKDWGETLEAEKSDLEGKIYELEQRLEETKLSYEAP